MDWQLNDARRQFGKLMTQALTEGPQRVQCDGDTVVVLSAEEYDRLTGQKPSLVEYLMSGPSLEGVDLTRDESPMRDVQFD